MLTGESEQEEWAASGPQQQTSLQSAATAAGCQIASVAFCCPKVAGDFGTETIDTQGRPSYCKVRSNPCIFLVMRVIKQY